MSMLNFLVFFMLLTVISSFFIVAFHDVTRHYIEVQPNGEEKLKGYLLKWWSVYWEYIDNVRIVFYSGEPLISKFRELNRLLPHIGKKFTINKEHNTLKEIDKPTNISYDDIVNIEAVLMCKIKTSFTDGEWNLYIEEPIYNFPSWVRKPLSSCVRCMASVYGTVIWVFVNKLPVNLYCWTPNKIWALIFFWFIFVITLSKLNDYIYKKTY